MQVKRDPSMPSRAFTGNFYVIGSISQMAIQSESTRKKAEDACEVLNGHNEKYNHVERYYIQNDLENNED